MSLRLCFHCGSVEGSVGACACLTCAKDVKIGACQACLGRRKAEKQRDVLRAVDVADIGNWTLHRPEAPARPYRTLKT